MDAYLLEEHSDMILVPDLIIYLIINNNKIEIKIFHDTNR